MARLQLVLGLVIATWLSGIAVGQTSYPMLMSLKPVAAQQGQTSEHTINSRYSMFGADQVLVSGTGVTGEIVHPEVKEGDKDKTPNLQTMKIKFTVAPDALPGVRDFRIATPRGVSTLGQLVITRDPVVAESAPNDDAGQAHPFAVPATVCGTIEKAEDVDFFKFHAPAGAKLNFNVRCMRLQDRIHDLQQHADPILTIRTAAGVTVASSDNYFYGDPFISHEFDLEGDYLLEIRDVRYQGNAYWEYSIDVSDQPFVTNVFPLAVRPGQASRLQLVGHHLPQQAQAEITLPTGTDRSTLWQPLPLAGASSNPVPLFVTDLPLVLESDGDNNAVEHAQLVTVPASINGRIESEADIDCFAFDAKKGEKLSFEVLARRQQSELDSHLRILTDQGKQLALNDDLRLGKRGYADSWVEDWTAPADGRYVIELRDLHLRGGDAFVYALNVTPSQPYFELYADTDKTQLSPGSNGAIFVRAVRKNGFDKEIQLHVDNLPSGVTAVCGRILMGKSQDGCIVLQAASDASLNIANVTIRGTSTSADGKEQLSAVATIYQETYQPGGGRGHWPVEMHTVAVAEPCDILAVTLSESEITLKPGESKQIDVTIQRAEGFDKNVTLDVEYKHLSSVFGNSLPEGVTVDSASSKTLLTAGATEGSITLKAADNAVATQRQVGVVMASVSLNFVMKASYTSQPLLVTVEPNP